MVKALLNVTGVPHTKDRTTMQVRQQLAAFSGVERFEVQAIPTDKTAKPDRLRNWDRAEIENGLGYLKARNAENFNIYIRPAPLENGTIPPYAFVDDADQETVDRMEADGLRFAILTESSPGNYQGWVRVDQEPVDPAELTRVCKIIAEKYGTDAGSADWRHHGRLAGFTNRKPKYTDERGRQPFVMLKRANPTATADDQLAIAREMLEREERLERTKQKFHTESIAHRQRRGESPIAAFSAAFEKANTNDNSARDFSAMLSMLRQDYKPAQIMAAVLEASPDLANRHRNPERYVMESLKKAEQIIRDSQRQAQPEQDQNYRGPRR